MINIKEGRMNLKRNSRERKRTDSTMAWSIKENSLIYLKEDGILNWMGVVNEKE